MTSTFVRIGLCMAMLGGTLLAGCSSLPNQVVVSQSSPSGFHTAGAERPNPNLQVVSQLGAFNFARVAECPTAPKFISQLGAFNLSDVDDVNGPIITNQIGAFNVVDDAR